MTNSVEKKVDALRVLKLRLYSHLSYDQIAKQMGCCKATVGNILSRFKDIVENPETVDAYEKTRGKILSAVEWEFIGDLMDKEKRQKASLNNVAYAFQQIFNARRLTEGQSTENIGLVAAILDADRLDRQEGQKSNAVLGAELQEGQESVRA